MRFLGVQRPVKHRFQRLHDDRMVPVLDLSTADATFEESDNGALNGDITPSGRLTFSKSASKLREFVNFPFLTDKELGEWIVQTRFMIILRGAPGSGKSYIASCIKERYPTAEVICICCIFIKLGFALVILLLNLFNVHRFVHQMISGIENRVVGSIDLTNRD